MKKSGTKRALFLSVLSIVLCFAMLMGSTFAWFTDSVSTGVNKIVAGNLDIELEYRDADGVWQPVTSTTSLFSEMEADGTTKNFWEPGHTEVVYLKVHNAGTLALKYSFAVNVADYVDGKTKEGKPIHLADYLVFGKIESKVNEEPTIFNSREDVWAEITEEMGLTSYTSEGTLKPEEVKYVTLAVYMPTSVNDDANYSGESVPSITLGVNLLATQDIVEFDSFSNDYDKEAQCAVYVSDAASLQEALSSGMPVVLQDNITVTGGFTVTTPNVVVDLNGHSITSTAPTEEDHSIAFKVSGESASLTIKGEGDVRAEGSITGANIAVWATKGAQVRIEGGNFSNSDESDLIYASHGTSTKAARIEIYGGTFSSVSGTDNQGGMQPSCIRLLNLRNESPSGQIEVYGGTYVNFNITKSDDWPQNNPTGSWMAAGYHAVMTEIDGVPYYTVVAD